MANRMKIPKNIINLTRKYSFIIHLYERLGLKGLISPQRESGRVHQANAVQVRNRHMLIADVAILLLIPTIATILRMDGLRWWSGLSQALTIYTGVALLMQITIFFKMGLYTHYWPSAGSYELSQVTIIIAISTAVLTLLYFILHPVLLSWGLPLFRSLPLISGLLTLVTLGGIRFGLRWLCLRYRCPKSVVDSKRILIVGAGEAGRMVVREVRSNPQLHLEAVAFVDDDPHKAGSKIEGLPVAGTIDQVAHVAKDLNLQEIIFAIPSAPLGRQKKIIALCEQSGVKVTRFPGVFDLLAGYKTISPVPRVDLYRLLDRKPIAIDQSEMVAVFKGAKVLVTGAGGSIGSGICQQIAQFGPDKLILLGHGENSIFEIGLKLKLACPDLILQPAIVDIRDRKGIDWIVEKSRPDVILHAAAHKHVPYMEDFICEAVTNNVLGTLNVVRAAQRYDVPRMVLISSDKAVNPTSIMGVTKRIAETIVQTIAWTSGRAYIAVRFGNVLGSRGSVLRIFQSQIRAGGPLTITHPEMRRYFMTIPEAVLLALQAAISGRGGEIFILDMGDQVRILDLATRLVNYSGLMVGRDIEIVFSGVRPGEKLEEELFTRHEMHGSTRYPSISVAIDTSSATNGIEQDAIFELVNLARNNQPESVNRKLQEIIPEYQPLRGKPAKKTVLNRSQSSKKPLAMVMNKQMDQDNGEASSGSLAMPSNVRLVGSRSE